MMKRSNRKVPASFPCPTADKNGNGNGCENISRNWKWKKCRHRVYLDDTG
jgi:hypothetical protein